MTKRACCCGGGVPEPPGVTGSFCCNPIFFTDFITLYGDNMAEHAEVSPQDWIGLVVTRPATAQADYIRSHVPPDGCNCCCGDCDDNPFNIYVDENLKKTNQNIIHLEKTFIKLKLMLIPVYLIYTQKEKH